MRVYRTRRDGIDVLRISGIIESGDADMLVSHIGSASARAAGSCGCCILDFAGVRHADHRVFSTLERLVGKGSGVIFSGFNDYLLSIFAFVSSTKMAPVFSDWRKAFRYLKVERGKLGVPATGRTEAAGVGPPEVDGR
jgi:hypothetical protein